MIELRVLTELNFRNFQSKIATLLIWVIIDVKLEILPSNHPEKLFDLKIFLVTGFLDQKEHIQWEQNISKTV